MSDPTQNPPDDSRPPGGSTPPPPPPGGSTPPPPPPGGSSPPPPPPGQPATGTGSYGTGAPPPSSGGWQQPGAMPPPVQAQTGGVGQPADLGPRFLARLIDYILLGIVDGVLVSFIVVGVLMGGDGSSLDTFGFGTGPSWAAGAVSSLLSAAIALGYFTLMEANTGQTVGKMILKLQTRGPDGGRPTTEQALRRNAFTAIGALGVVPFLGWLASLLSLAAVIMIAVTINKNTATRRGWHDDFAGGTIVFKVG